MRRDPNIADQSGMALMSLIGTVLVLTFVLTMAVKLIPVYLQHYNVLASLNNVAEEGRNGPHMSAADVRNSLLRQFSINDVALKRDVISVKKESSGRTEVLVDYEVRKPVVANIDVVVHFHNSATF